MRRWSGGFKPCLWVNPHSKIQFSSCEALKNGMECDSLPADLDEVSRKVLQLEIEREALRKEKDPVSQARLTALEKELSERQRDLQALKTRWDSEKASVARLRKTREAIEEVKLAIEKAERAYDLNRVAELRYGELPRLERELALEQEHLGKKQDSTRLLKEEVDEDDIAAIVSRWTGIPVSRLMEGETEKLLKLEELLHQRVVGQDEAVRA